LGTSPYIGDTRKIVPQLIHGLQQHFFSDILHQPI